MEKYLKLKENGQRENFIKISLDYSLGGMNYWNGHNEGRGYYIYVQPVERDERPGGFAMEGFMMGSGVKQLVKPVARRSDKAQKEAEALFNAAAIPLVEYVLEKYGLELENPDEMKRIEERRTDVA